MLSVDDPHFENDPPTGRRSVPKWPFFLGDGVLVLAALGVWSSTVALSITQLLVCLGSVGLGAIISIIPYILENIPTNAGDFFTKDSSNAKSTNASPTAESEWRRQARAAAEAVEHAARANAALESSARRFDARVAPLVEVHQGLTAVVAELREATAASAVASSGETLSIQREFERLRKEQAEKFKEAEEKIALLGETMAILAGHLKAIASRSAASANPAQVLTRVNDPSPGRPDEPSVVSVEEPVLAGAGVTVLEASPAFLPAEAKAAIPVEVFDQHVSNPLISGNAEAMALGSISAAAAPADQPRAINFEHGEEKSMLAKALARAQSSGQTPAVAGIIMARARRPRKSKFPVPGVVAGLSVVSESVISEPASTPPNPAEKEGWQSLAEGKFDAVPVGESKSMDEVSGLAAAGPVANPAPEIERPAGSDTSSAFRRSARAKAISLRGEEEEDIPKDNPVIFTPTQVEDSASPPSDEPTQGELLAREAETIRKRRSSRSPVQSCSLTVRVLIGIGNKPFVRGIGPGLSIDKGVPMEFVEIGQWRWVAPGAVKEPITVSILKNDEIPAEGEAIVLHPGQSMDVSPVFPN